MEGCLRGCIIQPFIKHLRTLFGPAAKRKSNFRHRILPERPQRRQDFFSFPRTSTKSPHSKFWSAPTFRSFHLHRSATVIDEQPTHVDPRPQPQSFPPPFGEQ